jgi:5-methylcytosine-specific restriction endonuclease McrA
VQTDLEKYKATATVVWEFESDLDHHKAIEQARADLSQQLSALQPQRVGVRLDKHKKSKNIVLGEFPSEEVLRHVTNGDQKHEYKIGDKSYFARMNSHRYFVFRASRSCAACGIEGTAMRLEQHPCDKSPHFNLYAIEDGKSILMTKDHIQAKSTGGEDRLSNYQTMCCICNNLKGSDPLTLAEIRHLRHIYNKYNRKLTRKKLNARMRVERAKLVIHTDPKEKPTKPRTFVAKCDLLIMRTPEGVLEGMSAYEAVDRGEKMIAVACVKKGSQLRLACVEGKKLGVKFNDERYGLFLGYADCPN